LAASALPTQASEVVAAINRIGNCIDSLSAAPLQVNWHADAKQMIQAAQGIGKVE
jgi:hypothetical protein